MTFNLEFETDYAAFEDTPCEIARILRRIADDVEEGEPSGPVVDANGNTVGRWSL